MKQIQILLPLFKDGEAISSEVFFKVRKELTDKFGGITTYTRSPATGLWKDEQYKTVRDEIVIYEVLSKELDKEWWRKYKKFLESAFQQDEIMIRAWDVEIL